MTLVMTDMSESHISQRTDRSGSPSHTPSIMELPYNPNIRLITQNNIIKLFKKFEIYDLIRNSYCKDASDKKEEIPMNMGLYHLAFVHKSYCTRKNENIINGNDKCPEGCLPLQENSNERLEYLGDSVLNLATANYLFDRYPNENEGFLTFMRTKLVNGTMLSKLCLQMGINKYLILSQQIDNNNGKLNKDLTEDLFEALIGAIYKNYGFDIASEWIVNIFEEYIEFADLIQTSINYKDKLVKLFQQTHQPLPKFIEIDNSVGDDGIENEVTVCIKTHDDIVIGIGTSNTKKKAEREASKKALEYYNRL
jgi:ribonuclease-3